jgi:putative PIN family toxin of toxin-antitoxin system
MRAVLDTNVIVSAVLSSSGPPDAILRAWRRGRFQLIISAPLLQELVGVLARPAIRRRAGFSPEESAELVATIADTAVVVEPSDEIHVFAEDPDDNRLLEAAVAARADYIVSGDKLVVALASFRDSQIISPARFLVLLTAEPESE